MTAQDTAASVSEQASFVYGDETISYEIVRKPFEDIGAQTQQQVGKIKIHVSPDCQVAVSAPSETSAEQVHKAVLKRARWIWKHLDQFRAAQQFVFSKRYVSGEMQFYLGRRYVLKVLESVDAANRVKLVRGQLQVSLVQGTENKACAVKVLVDQWYRDKAMLVFKERLTVVQLTARWVEGTPPFKLITMQKQWGSCSAKGTLTLNPHLVKAPKSCIDYVILHELCHLAEHNHSEHFWRLLGQVMPDWKAQKQRLDGMAELYLNG